MGSRNEKKEKGRIDKNQKKPPDISVEGRKTAYLVVFTQGKKGAEKKGEKKTPGCVPLKRRGNEETYGTPRRRRKERKKVAGYTLSHHTRTWDDGEGTRTDKGKEGTRSRGSRSPGKSKKKFGRKAAVGVFLIES